MIKISSRVAFEVVGRLKYIAFLCLGLYFICECEVLDKFGQKRTNFAIFREKLSELPTLTTYLHNNTLEIGVDFNLTFQSVRSGAFKGPKPLTNLTRSGMHSVGVEDNYEPFKIEFEANLYGVNVFKITPVLDPEVSTQHIGDLILTYSFQTTSKYELEGLITSITLTQKIILCLEVM